MKKEYVAPSAEKMSFDYTESVVASDHNCGQNPSKPVFYLFFDPRYCGWH